MSVMLCPCILCVALLMDQFGVRVSESGVCIHISGEDWAW